MMRENTLSYAIRLACASGLLAAGTCAPALAQQSEPTMQRVEITGSSLRRTANETALPVTVLSRADIDKSGVQTTEELLGQINSVSSAGGQVNGGQSGLTTYGKSAVSLRGLGSDKTLVLVNGRRLANFAGGASSGADVNVNAIPLSAIERVEVLQDGASGVYGSDAIAGVVNFILRKEFKGIEISGLHGRPTRSGGGARQNKLGVVAGFGDYDTDRFSVVLSGAIEKEGNLLGAQRDYANSDTRLPYFEGGATETGRIEGTWDFPGGATEFDAGTNARSDSNPYGVSGTGYGNPMAALGKCGEIGMIPRSGKGFSAGAPDDTKTTPNCTFDTGPFVSLVPNRKFKGGTSLLRFKINEQNELYASALYSKNEFVNPIQPAPLRQAFYAGNTLFTGSGVDPALLIYPSNPNYQIAADYLNSVGLGAMVGHPLAVSQRTFLLGQRTTRDIAKQHQYILGGKGMVGGLNYDVAYIHNLSKTEGNVIDGFASIFGLSKVLNDPSVHWNPWAPLGQQSPEVAKLIAGTKYAGPTIEAKSRNEGIDAKVDGTLMTLPAGDVGLAAGLQARDESFDLVPAPATLTGDVIGLGGAITEVHAKRSVWAVFAETEVPLAKGLSGNLALRRDSYSDFGKTTNYKASVRYQPMESLLARASVGSGFRAPSLTALYAPQQVNTSEQFTDPAFPGNGQIQVTSITGGNPNLKPEESDQFSIGVVLQPTRSFAASFDFYSIKVDGLIAAPSAQQIVSGYRRGAAGFDSLVEVLPNGEISKVYQFNANVNSVKTQGVDVDLRYKENLLGGKFVANLNGTWVRKFDLVNTDGEIEDSVGTIVRPDGAPLVASPTGVILKWKHNLSFSYQTGPWSATLTQRYYKGYRDANDLDGNEHHVKGQALYDLVASWGGWRSLKLTLGVRNLFDKDPPLFIHNGSQFQSGYDVYQYDPRGRFVYVSASYKF